MTSAHDTSDRLFIVEQAGTIKVLQTRSGDADRLSEYHVKSVIGGERGLLGLAFHPQFATNRRFFIYYTRQTDGAIVIAEYQFPQQTPKSRTQLRPSS